MIEMAKRAHTRLTRTTWRNAGALLLLVASCNLAWGADLRWANRSFQIVANEKPLADFIRELAASQGLTAVVDSKVAGNISGAFSGSARSTLDSVCLVNGLTWYFDGAFLYVDPAAESKSEVMAIAKENAERIAETLVRLQISDARYPLNISGDEGSVYVTGPRRYIEMVRQAVRLVDQRTALTDGAEVRLFPLRYAWASDIRINRSGRETVIPGVASMLRSLWGRGSGTAGSSGASVRGLAASTGLSVQRQARLRAGDIVNQSRQGDAAGGIAPAGDSNLLAGGGNLGAGLGASMELPQFQADTRMNAVLVRDAPDRMAQYAKLIQAMDVRPRLVEIEVTIMDISSDTLSSLGIDWRLHAGRHFDFQTGRGNQSPLTWSGGTSEAGQIAGNNSQNGNPLTPLGSMLTAAIGNSERNYLLARVTALASDGAANFVARPRVMTLDNTEAVLENLSELYVRVQGFQDAGLFSVTSGTAVRVTPLIVEDQGARGVMMSIDIIDGDLSPASVDQIPIVRRRTVNTQAMVAEGASLLIAGYSSEERSNAVTGVPMLKDIPALGNLFKYRDKKQVSMERFYLLTPRLAVPSQTAGLLPPAPLGPSVPFSEPVPSGERLAPPPEAPREPSRQEAPPTLPPAGAVTTPVTTVPPAAATVGGIDAGPSGRERNPGV